VNLRLRRPSARGFMLIDVMIATFLVVLLALGFFALHSASTRSAKAGEDYSRAIALAQREIEQLRLVGYNNLGYSQLYSLSLVDGTPNTSPYSFDHVVIDDGSKFSAATALKDGHGRLTIWNINDQVKGVEVQVTWTSQAGNTRNVTLGTAIGS
jgi:hypothetical protein